MTHLISGLMSWVNSGSTKSYRSELLTWAKTEYSNDWEFAYNYMLTHNGRAPTTTELHGPRFYRKEVA